jgi:NDP-sugar pyrophosphorylase family protein
VLVQDRAGAGIGLGGLDVVVLAGGLGTRLRPVVADRPKVLAPVAGRPFLDHLLAWLASQGARRAVLSLGHLAEQVERHLASAGGRPPPGLAVEAAREPEPLGTGGALVFCRPRLRSDPVMVVNGDTFVEVDLAAFAASFAASGAEAGLVAVRVPDAARYGRLELSARDRVERFAEKDPAASGPAWINGGVYLLAARALDRLPAAGPSSLERDLLERLPPGSVAAFRAAGRFVDIGTPASLAEAPAVLAGNLAEPLGRP